MDLKSYERYYRFPDNYINKYDNYNNNENINDMLNKYSFCDEKPKDIININSINLLYSLILKGKNINRL